MKNKKSNVWSFATAKLQAKINISLLILILAVIGFSMVACDNGSNNTPTTYPVTVNGGSGSGSYAAGATVSISATVPSGQTFTNWTVNSGGATLANANSASTTFIMLANAVTVTANFTGGETGGGGGNNNIEKMAGDWLWYNPNNSADKGAKITIDTNGEFIWYMYTGDNGDDTYRKILKGTISLNGELNGTITYTAVWVDGTSTWDSSDNAFNSMGMSSSSSRSGPFTINGTSSGSILTIGEYTWKKQ